MRDTLKTIIGLVIIGAIVVATFLYGNAQRQAQLNRDKDAKKQTAQVTATPTASPVVTQAAGSNGSANTAPVNTPSSNAIQGGGTPKPSSAPVTGGSNTNGQVAGAATTVPVTGGTGTNLPDTGSPLMGLVGVAAIAGAFVWLRRSQSDVLAAVRTRR